MFFQNMLQSLYDMERKSNWNLNIFVTMFFSNIFAFSNISSSLTPKKLFVLYATVPKKYDVFKKLETICDSFVAVTNLRKNYDDHAKQIVFEINNKLKYKNKTDCCPLKCFLWQHLKFQIHGLVPFVFVFGLDLGYVNFVFSYPRAPNIPVQMAHLNSHTSQRSYSILQIQRHVYFELHPKETLHGQILLFGTNITFMSMIHANDCFFYVFCFGHVNRCLLLICVR